MSDRAILSNYATRSDYNRAQVGQVEPWADLRSHRQLNLSEEIEKELSGDGDWSEEPSDWAWKRFQHAPPHSVAEHSPHCGVEEDFSQASICRLTAPA